MRGEISTVTTVPDVLIVRIATIATTVMVARIVPNVVAVAIVKNATTVLVVTSVRIVLVVTTAIIVTLAMIVTSARIVVVVSTVAMFRIVRIVLTLPLTTDNPIMQRIVITVDLIENPGKVEFAEDAVYLLNAVIAKKIVGEVSIETADSVGFKRRCGYSHAEFCSDCFGCDDRLACKLVEDYSR
jgi:hypothetical protein